MQLGGSGEKVRGVQPSHGQLFLGHHGVGNGGGLQRGGCISRATLLHRYHGTTRLAARSGIGRFGAYIVAGGGAR